MPITATTAKKAASLKAGLVNNSFVDGLTFSTIDAASQSLPTILPEYDNYLYSTYGDRLGIMNYFRMAGKVVDIAGQKFTTFSSYAPYQNYTLDEASSGQPAIAVSTNGASITFKLEAANYVDSQPPLRTGQLFYLPVKYTQSNSVLTTKPEAFRIESVSGSGTALTFTAKPLNALVKVAVAVPKGTEIVPGGFLGARGGDVNGGFVDKVAQQTWKTSYLTHRLEFEEGTAMEQDIFTNLPKGLLKANGYDENMTVRAINPSIMSSAVGRTVLENVMLYNKARETQFVLGSENTNGLTVPMKDATTKNAQSSKGLIPIIEEQGMACPRTGSLAPSDMTGIEELLRSAGYYAKDINTYIGPDLNNEIATGFTTWLKDNSRSDFKFGDGINVNYSTIRWGALNMNFLPVENWGDPNWLGSQGFGLSNRGLLIPNEESNVTIGGSEETVKLPNVSVLQNRGNGFDRSYMVGWVDGFTEFSDKPTHTFGSATLGMKGEFGVCAPTAGKIVNLTKAL